MARKKTDKKISFLVAEPNTEKRTKIIEILNKLGHPDVNYASDGAAAYRFLKRRPMDCVISAWEMPQMNGISLLKVIRSDEELYSIPFFMVTRHISKEKVFESGRYGVSTILVEPVQMSQLKQKIESILYAPVDADFEKTDSLFKQAKDLTADGLYNKALRLYKEILEIHEDAEVYFNIGYIKTVQEKYDEALLAFKKAVLINSVHGRAYKMLGTVHMKMGDREEAEKCFQKAGDIFLERQMDSEAEEAFKEVLKLNPDTLNVYNSLGIIYRRQQNAKKAVTLYQLALKVSPDDEHVYYNLARAHLENKDVKSAKEALGNALKLNPLFNEAKKLLAAIEIGF